MLALAVNNKLIMEFMDAECTVSRQQLCKSVSSIEVLNAKLTASEQVS